MLDGLLAPVGRAHHLPRLNRVKDRHRLGDEVEDFGQRVDRLTDAGPHQLRRAISVTLHPGGGDREVIEDVDADLQQLQADVFDRLFALTLGAHDLPRADGVEKAHGLFDVLGQFQEGVDALTDAVTE